MTFTRSRTQNLFAGAAIVATLLMQSVRPAVAKDCDRGCLGDLVTQYLNDMAGHNPGALPVSPNVRFTENGEVMKLGEGLWRTASGLGAYRQDIFDVEEHTAATQAVVLQDGDKPVLFALRLKERDGNIGEIETMVVPQDKDSLLFDPAGYQKGNEQMAFVPPASEIGSRAEAIEIAMKYPQGLKVGSFVQVDTPFASDAYRIENGVHTAGAGCTRAGCENIKTQKIIQHPGIQARVAAFDAQLGVVLLYLDFGNTEQYGAGRALVTFEAFKIYGGQIHAVNAVLHMASTSTASGWGPELPVKVPPAK
ncbi:MAG: hypothetical protein ABSD31_21460 [Candidatus Binataceae bacterium]|jgi:hypothetical protein